jgi:hypothetical protein
MSRLKSLGVVAFLVLLITMPACGAGVAEVQPITFDDVMGRANERRRVVHERDMGRIYAHIEGRTPSAIEWARLFYSPRAAFVSGEEATEDVMILFDLLKHWYGAYEYFGGDAVFLPLRDELVASLADTESMLTFTFSQMIQNVLSQALADNHFLFDGAVIGVQYNFFVWETPFVRSENGLRERETGRYLTEVAGYELDEIFRLAMDEDAELFYAAVIHRPQGYGLTHSVTAIFEGGEKEIIRLRNVSALTLTTPARDMNPSLVFEGDIPVVSIATLDITPDTAHTLMSFAAQLRRQPYIYNSRHPRKRRGAVPILSGVAVYPSW